MKIEKPLWIVQPQVSPTEIFRTIRPGTKMISWPTTNVRNASSGTRSAPFSAIQPTNAAAKTKPIR